MSEIPIIAFSAWSGTGKTTIIEKLIAEFKRRNVRVAVIKHDAHDFEIDRKGKDSWRFAQAGADITVISSEEKTALIEQRSLEFEEAISLIHDVDLILAEGYNQEKLPRIGISRKAAGKGFRLPLSEYIAVITDEDSTFADNQDKASASSASGSPLSGNSLPVFSLTSIPEIADFILDFIKKSR